MSLIQNVIYGEVPLYAHLYTCCTYSAFCFVQLQNNCTVTVIIIFVGLNVSCQVDPTTGQLSSSVQLLNVDKCSGKVGPAVPIRMSTSVNSSVTLHCDGQNETVGDISVQSLPCNNNNTQVYNVSVPFPNTTYTITAEIRDALLPKCFFRVTNSSKSLM